MINKELITILDEINLSIDEKSHSEIQADFELAKNGPISTAFAGTGITPLNPVKARKIPLCR